MSLTRLLAGAAVAALLVLFATPAMASPSNKTKATRAVRAEVKSRYSIDLSDVTCTSLTSRRFKCEYVGFVRGHDGPCRGTARATVYAGATDVTSVSRYRCDF